MKKFLILAIIALSMIVSVNAEMDYNNSNYYGVINEPGTYVLSEDIFVSAPKWGGIWINSSNVVFDGQNHQLICINGSDTYGVDVYTDSEGTIENITIKNLIIKNWTSAVYLGDDTKNITVMNCEFENNSRFLESSTLEQYFYLNTIHGNQNVSSYNIQLLSSPKLVYNYNGNEYTYRLGNYYVGEEFETETEDEGVYSGVYEVYGEEGFIAYDPYVLIETPENYGVLEVLYPEVYDEEDVQVPGLIADIFALDSRFENYVITDAPVTTTTTSSSSSGRGGGSSYDSDC